MIVDFRRNATAHTLLNINASAVQTVKILGVQIMEDRIQFRNVISCLGDYKRPACPLLSSTPYAKGPYRTSPTTLVSFGNCSFTDKKSLQQIVRTAEGIIRANFRPVTEIHHVPTIYLPLLQFLLFSPLMWTVFVYLS